MQRQITAGEKVLTYLTEASDRLAQIMEQDRQRLSHRSRMHLDYAERDLRCALECLTTVE